MMSYSIAKPGKAAEIVEVSSHSNVDEAPEAGQSGVRLHNVRQAVLAQTLNNAQGANLVLHGASASAGSEGFSQSISTGGVDIQSELTYETNNKFYIREDSTILKWLFSLSPFQFEKKQYENTRISTTGPGTGQWLLESLIFTNWRDGESTRLWCYGPLGAGKTILASIIINHLQHGFSFNHNMACIYVYFDYRDQKRQNLTNLLSSLLAQLVRNRDEISQEIKEIHHAWGSRGMYPSPDECLQMLKSQVKSIPRVFIVVDALDECSNDPGTNTRDAFVKALCQLPRNVHVLFTSRPDMNIRNMVQADSEFEIMATSSDLRRYLENFINSREHLRLLVDRGLDNHKSFLSTILDVIVARSQGMFLLAQLYAESLDSKSTLESFESDIVNIPKKLDKFYRITLERISSQVESMHSLAIRALTWLVFAERPLAFGELKHALAAQVGDRTLPEERFVTREALTSACAGFVIIDHRTDTVCLSHYTIEKYLRDNESTIFEDPQSHIAESCLVYLSFEEFNRVASSYEVLDRRKKYPFISYAADYWGYHVSHGVRGSVYRLAWEFIFDAPKVMSALQVMDHPRFKYQIDITSLHYAAYFGMDKLAKKLLNKGFAINARTRSNETALHWAAFYGQRRFLKVLIDLGADLNVQDQHGLTALHKAIISEDVLSVELLLSSSRQIDLSLEDSKDWTVLRRAAAFGLVSIVEMLLGSGADVDAQDKDGWTALRWAAQRGHKRIVELLVRNRASLETSSSDRWTLLRSAAQEGREPFIQLLIEKRVNLNAMDTNGRTALRWAIEYGHGITAWLLIQAHADVNTPDNKGFTPLHSAVETWHASRDKSLIWLLLEKGAHINAQTKLGLTALHIAATRGYSSVVLLLLEKGANTGRLDNNKRTALHCAIIEGHEAAVKILLHKVNGLIHATDDEKRTALHIAASAGNLPIAELLLNNGAEIDIRDMEGSTPLDYAVYHQHYDMVFHLKRSRGL